MKRKNSIIVISLLALATINGAFFHLPLAESQTIDPLPVILIHGYRQDASSWNLWEELLQNKHIPYYKASFEDGMCGSSADHAIELSQIVEHVKQETQSEKVNIVGFSKGGLDARVYLQDGNKNIANLIMIGTPNGGAPLAYWDTICTPAADDLKFGSEATQAGQNINTKYYTIYGDWIWYIWIWYIGWTPQEGNTIIPGRDDGIVPVISVNSENYFINIGKTYDRHSMLQTENEFYIACPILLNKTQCS
jgi:pimeloyl-ACP methyl ester carboxylesterase